jgi:hypothetical protein
VVMDIYSHGDICQTITDPASLTVVVVVVMLVVDATEKRAAKCGGGVVVLGGWRTTLVGSQNPRRCCLGWRHQCLKND